MKKILSFIMVLAMILSLGIAASAVTITINDAGVFSQYAAYRLLDATNSPDNNKLFAYTLNSKYTSILQEITEKTTQADIIKYIAGLDGDEVRTFADEVYAKIKNATPAIASDETTTNCVFADVPQGYYLIAETIVKDNTDVISLVMLDTAGVENVEIDTKESKPILEKKVKDTDDSVLNSTTGWQDSADYDIGDTIPYKLTGTLPSEYAKYKTYSYSFSDSMNKLTYVDKSARVVVLNDTTETNITDSFNIKWSEDSKTLTVSCPDLKQITGATINAKSKIIVYYSATLDADAVIGSAGNPNTARLSYSNNPYGDGEGITPVDTNIVFTFKAVVNKVDKDEVSLKGAGFTLYKLDAESGEYAVVVTELKGENMVTFEFSGLDAGKYKLIESTVPAGYNKADDIEFEIVAEHETTADSPTLTSLVVKGKNGDTISGERLTFSADKTTGILSTDVVNTTGTELPSTGGIGTTIFYVVGGTLVAAAVVLLVTKKRMSVNG